MKIMRFGVIFEGAPKYLGHPQRRNFYTSRLNSVISVRQKTKVVDVR